MLSSILEGRNRRLSLAWLVTLNTSMSLVTLSGRHIGPESPSLKPYFAPVPSQERGQCGVVKPKSRI